MPPAIWAPMNSGTQPGAIPAYVSVRLPGASEFREHPAGVRSGHGQRSVAATGVSPVEAIQVPMMLAAMRVRSSGSPARLDGADDGRVDAGTGLVGEGD